MRRIPKTLLRTAFLLCATTIAGAGTARAAQFGIVEAPDGWLIRLHGPIERGDAAQLAKAIAATSARPSRIVVSMGSTGGDLVEATTMGLALQQAGAVTYVGDGAICMSACGIAWLGGTHRVVSASGHIGFHAPYDRVTHEVSPQGRDWLATYIAALGIDPRFIDYIYAKRLGQGLEWLTDADARSYRLAMVVAPSNTEPGSTGSTVFIDTLDKAEEAYRSGGDESLAAGLRRIYAAFADQPSVRYAFLCFATELAVHSVDEQAAQSEGRIVDRRFSTPAWQARMESILGGLGYAELDSRRILNTWIGLSNKTMASEQ